MIRRYLTRIATVVAALWLSSSLAFAAGQLKLWYQVGSKGEIAALRAMVDSFKRKYPDIALELNEVDFETYRSLIRSAVASSDPPDVFKYWAGAWPASMVQSNLLQDIDAFWAKEKLDGAFAPWARQLNSHGGKVYGVPVRSFSSVVFYRKDLFAKYKLEVPADRWPSWEQFLGYAKTLKQNGVTPFTVAGGPMWPLQYWLGYIAMRSDGDELWNQLLVGKAKWTDPRVKAWFLTWAELLKAGYYAPNINAIDYHEQQLAFFEGRAAMDLGLFNIFDTGKAMAPNVEIDYFNFPVMRAGVPKMMHHQTDSFFMSAKAKNKENGYLWLKHVAETEVAALYPKLGGGPPGNMNVPDDAYTSPVVVSMVKDRNAYPGPISLDIGLPPAVSAEAMRQLQLFVTKPTEATIDTALKAIEAASREQFGN